MPEHPQAELELAGTGARSLAGLVDLLVQGLLTAAIAEATGLNPWDMGEGVFRAIGYASLVLLIAMPVVIAYYTLFELLWHGQSPGKRLTGLAVVRDDGGRVGLGESLFRNILRPADMLPGPYGVGLALILTTSQRKRLGDMVAGTIVVNIRAVPRDEPITIAPLAIAPPRAQRESEQLMIERARLHLSALTPQEADTIARFIEQRLELDHDARAAVATRIANSLREKFPGLPPRDVPSPEAFLEIIHAARTGIRD